jgi:hypothetical protein
MIKRKIELPLSTIDEIVKILAGVEAVGNDTIALAEKKGVDVPRKFLKKIAEISNTLETFKKANDDVEIAELEEMFLRSFEEKA